MNIGAHFKLHPMSIIVYKVIKHTDHHFIGQPVNEKCSNVEVRYSAEVCIVNRPSGEARNLTSGRQRSVESGRIAGTVTCQGANHG